MLIFQDIINCVQAIPQIPEKKLCVCFIKTTYLLLDVMICVLLQNVLLLRLNWGKNQYFLLAVISINPSQNSRWIWELLSKFSLNIIKIDHTSTFCSVVIGDFDFNCKNWLAWDVNLNVGKELDSLTSTRGYDQLVDKLTPFLVADLLVLI